MQNVENRQCNILYVDDEVMNLKVFQASFRRDYNIFTATSGEEGLRIFNENDIQVIVTDQRMPGMTGVQFLQKLAEEPDNIRIILTGYSDMEAIIEAINTGKVYRYITKPWDKNELKITLDNALETVMLRRNNRQLIQELKEYNSDLEEKVRLRTAEIEEQKDMQLRLVQAAVQLQTEFAQKEKEVAERTALLKQQFMANMSHEIRTPMNAIVGMTRLLLAKDPRPDQLRYLNPIQLSANNLLVIINDILDLSKIEAGKIVIENTPFSLREVAHCLQEMLSLKADEKGLEFRVRVDNDIPKRLVGDPTRLNQVLVNLAGNSIKFTTHGYVEIVAVVERREHDGLWIRFDVTDTGIGIGAEYLSSIFDRFTQAGADVTRKFGGTGLGLTISKQLVNLMGGEMTVKSELNKGTTFTAVIPFKEAIALDEVAVSGMPDQGAIARLGKMKVLLVEDNEFNRMVAEDTLKDIIPGIRVYTAVNGLEAINCLQKETYDVVLMDIQMPVMDGLEATKHIRQTMKEPARNVKIIAMTANVLHEDVRQYFLAGMNAYVSKPFNSDELLLKMDNVMNETAAPRDVHGAKNTRDERQFAPLPSQVTSRTFLEQFTGGNREKQQKYIGMFLENAPKLLANLDQALEAKDYQAIKVTAHSLKPQLAYMGVKEDVSNIFLIEQSAGEKAHYETLPALINNLKRLCAKAFEELGRN